jgi:DNA-directed RNA polymerase specialized sigma subunit
MKLPQSSAENSKRLVEKLAELERQINEQIDETVDSKREALVVLSCLEGEERTVMYDYYILAKDWLKIAEELFMSDRRVFNLRKSAFEKLEKRYGNSDDKESA